MFIKILQSIGFSICHQLPARSFTFFNQSPCLCVRCLGIYSSVFIFFGYFFGFKVLIKKEKPSKFFSRRVYFFALFLILLMVLDALLQYAEVYFSNSTRLLSGIAFGYGLSLFLVSLLSDSFTQKNTQKEPFAKKEFLALGGAMIFLAAIGLTLNDYVLFGMHVMAILGILCVFISANYLLIVLLSQKILFLRRTLFQKSLISVIATTIELGVLFFAHLQVADQIRIYFG